MSAPSSSSEPSRATGSDTPRTVVELVRWIYLGGRTGLLEVAQEEGRRRLYFRRGELYLPGAHPLAVLLKPRLRAKEDRSSFGEDSELVSLLGRIARTVATWNGTEVLFHEGEEHLPRGLLGPFPTSLVVMEQAVADVSEDELRQRLGGNPVRLRAVRTDPGLLGVAALTREELELLQRLGDAPVPLGRLLKESEDDAILLRLARLDAVGLIERLPAGRPSPEDVSGSIVRRFAERVARNLEQRPVDLAPQEHREQLADLLARLGEMSYYDLLGVPVEATAEEVHDAFNRLARLVHPLHAEPLGLIGREGALELLFERATEGYLTLTDPRRRSEYDRKHGLTAPKPQQEERSEEKRELARRYYQRAAEMAEAEDYGTVVDLLRDAVRNDPRPEYYALMGLVQAKNPNWLRDAAESLERARRGGLTRNLEIDCTLAEVYEQLDRTAAAAGLFQAVLEYIPGEPRAERGLERVGGPPSGEERGWWRKLLGG
jgi:curved DNA-binding protein CbpA